MSDPKPRVTLDQIARIRSRTGLSARPQETEKMGMYPFDRRPVIDRSSIEGKLVTTEVQRYEKNPRFPTFPTELVIAALRATDVVLPKGLETLVSTITKMYLEQATPQAIAEATNLPLAVVEKELTKLPGARMVAFKRDPELAATVVKATLDVTEEILDTARMAKGVLKLMEVEIQEAFTGRNDALEPEDPCDEAATPKKTSKQRRGISNFKTDSFWKGIDSIKGLAELAAKVQGLLAPAANKVIQQNNIQVNAGNGMFASDEMNRVADILLREAGVDVLPCGQVIDV